MTEHVTVTVYAGICSFFKTKEDARSCYLRDNWIFRFIFFPLSMNECICCFFLNE